MKKLLAIGLILLLTGSALFAEDASVMPKMVGRFYVAPIYSFAMGEYDTDGDYHNLPYDDISLKLFNLGFALEYGINNWITGAIQWVPGWTPWSNIRAATGWYDTNTNGVADIFAGAKFQIVGEDAPVKASMVRFSAAPGVIIPLPGPNFEDQFKKVNLSTSSGNDATLYSMDNHVFAAGGRVYFDFVINKNFFINLYNETIIYPFKQDLNKAGANFYGAKWGAVNNPYGDPEIKDLLDGLAAYGIDKNVIYDISGDVSYNYSLTFEIEPVFSMPIADGINFTAGLPVTYNFKPAYSYSFSYPAALASLADMITPGLKSELDTDPHHILSLNPNVSVFFMKTLLPLEFKFTYGLPVWGQNALARHNASLQIRAYFALPGR